MKLGICTSLEAIEGLNADNFDFIEVNVQNFLVPELEEAQFLPHLEQAQRAAKPVKAANLFLPAHLKSVGPDADFDKLARYARNAFSRAEQTGIEMIVFGSGGSRSVPEGYPLERAKEDFVRALKLFGPIAQSHGVTLVIEPLNRKECNFINSLDEGAEMVRRCDHPGVQLLADFYHMRVDNEPASEITRFGELIVHTHVAELAGRFFPGKSGEDFRPFFEALRQIGYVGAISIECRWDNIRNDLDGSIRYLRGQIA